MAIGSTWTRTGRWSNWKTKTSRGAPASPALMRKSGPKPWQITSQGKEMASSQLASTIVTHRCGHNAARKIKSFNPNKKRYDTILNPDYLRAQDAPRVMQERAANLYQDNKQRCEDYWSGQDCPSCWRKNPFG